MSEAGVLQALRRGAGKRYDPEMVEAFFSRLNTIRAIGKRFPDEK
jgi:response regulator RpfG family c-di-GMP phosphodiesterase